MEGGMSFVAGAWSLCKNIIGNRTRKVGQRPVQKDLELLVRGHKYHYIVHSSSLTSISVTS